MSRTTIPIDKLIEIVAQGGSVKTGVDVFNNAGVLLLEKDVRVENANILRTIKRNGVSEITINPRSAGFVRDADGNGIDFPTSPLPAELASLISPPMESTIEQAVQDIIEIKKEAATKYTKAKQNIKTVILDIRQTGGEFDYEMVEETVMDLFGFLTQNQNAFAYLTKEIFSYDDYLYNHSINVCTVGTAVLRKFNTQFSQSINTYLNGLSAEDGPAELSRNVFNYMPEDDMRDMALGFFLHDVGKVLIPDQILNKKGRLTPGEFAIVRTHSFEKGLEILEKNNIGNPLVRKSVKLHHAGLFHDEANCYPKIDTPVDLPAYVKICKLADIYDAMTSKRCYKEAINPIMVVTEIFRKYARKDPMLQFILHSFVKAVGIYPPGSIVYLKNRQMSYVIDSQGPIVLPFTDTSGATLRQKPDPINLADAQVQRDGIAIDRNEPLVAVATAYRRLPNYLKNLIKAA